MPPARFFRACAKDEVRFSVLLAALEMVLVIVSARVIAGRDNAGEGVRDGTESFVLV